MKKLLCLALAFALVLTAAGCSRPHVEAEAIPEAPAETTPTFQLTATLEEQVLMDQDGLKVTALGLREGLRGGPELEIQAENHSGRTLAIGSNLESVNGFMIESLFYLEIPDGETVTATIPFTKQELVQAGITDVATISLILEVWEFDSQGVSQGLYCSSGWLELETSIAGSFAQPSCDRGQVLYDRDGLRILCWEPQGELNDPPLVHLYVENNSDMVVFLSAAQAAINGEAVPDSYLLLYNEGIAPGKCVIEEVWLSSEGKEAFSPSDVEELTFSLQIRDDLYDAYADVYGEIPMAFLGSGAGDLRPAGSGNSGESGNGGSFFDGFQPGAPEVAGYREFIESYLWVDALHNSDLPSPEEYDSYEWGYYYLHDINADGTFELIMVAGVYGEATCLIYTWDGGIVFVGSKTCAYGVGVGHVPGEPVIVLCEYQGGYEEFLTLAVDVDRLTVQADYYEPDGWVGLEPTGIGQDYAGPGVANPDDGYQGPTEAPDGNEEPKDLPGKEFFLNFVYTNYSDYDHSGLYADEPYWDAQKGWAWCDVYLPVSHPYAQEIRVFHVYARYSPSYEAWDDPGCTDIDYRMDWDVSGVWTLEGDGSFGGGTEGVRLEIYETGSDYVLCSYDIAVMENTFGNKEYDTLVGGGNLPLEGPDDIFGKRMCWLLVDQSSDDYFFYLNPEVGVYYRSANSTTVVPQPMIRAD